MTSKLLEVPAEILACIADELEIEHYGNLRLANRQMHDYTFPYFAKKFFSRRKFFRDYLSLSTLLSISESRLSPYLENVILGIELLEFNGPPGEAPNVFKEAYYKAYADQTSILATGWDRDTLVDSLRNLPNLKGVGVESFDDGEDWDFDEGRLNSTIEGGYGLKTLLRNLGYEAGRPPHQASPVTQWVTAVQTLLIAVAKSGAKPRSLSVVGKSVNNSYSPSSFGVDGDAFNIPSFLEQALAPVIEEFVELDLAVYDRMLYPSFDDPATCRTCHLRRFLGMPKRLEKLRVAQLTGSMAALENSEEKGGFWTWLGWSPKGKGKAVMGDDEEGEDANDDNQQWQWEMTPTNPANPLTSPPPISLPHLRELHLAREDILFANLTRLLNKVAPTLEKLDLHDVNMRDRIAEIDNIQNINDDDNDNEPADPVRTEVELWITLVSKLAAMPCDELREVNISGFGGLGTWHMEKFGTGGGVVAQPDSVYFRELNMVEVDSYTTQAKFSYKGRDVKGALGRLENDLRAAIRDGRHVFVWEPPKRRNSF